MAQQLRFLAQPLPNVPSDELLRRYRHIDELGFDLAAMADHFVDWNHVPNPWFEAMDPSGGGSPGKPQASGWRPG